MESAPKGCGGVGHRRVRAGQRGPPRRGAQGTPRGWRVQVWGTHSQDVCTEAGSNLDSCVWDTTVRLGHVHKQRDRSITKACSGPGTQSTGACMAPTDRAQSAAGVGTPAYVRPLPPEPPACLPVAGPLPTVPTIFENPDLTRSVLKTTGPHGPRDRSRGPESCAPRATPAFSSQSPASRRSRSLACPASATLGDCEEPAGPAKAHKHPPR